MYCNLDEAWGKQYTNNINDPEYTEFLKYKKQKQSLTDKDTNLELFDMNDKKNNVQLNTYTLSDKNTNDYINNKQINIDSKVDEQLCKCDNILNHIHNCPECLKKIYIKYSCFGRINDTFTLFFTNETKEKLTIILLGILTLLMLCLTKL